MRRAVLAALLLLLPRLARADAGAAAEARVGEELWRRSCAAAGSDLGACVEVRGRFGGACSDRRREAYVLRRDDALARRAREHLARAVALARGSTDEEERAAAARAAFLLAEQAYERALARRAVLELPDVQGAYHAVRAMPDAGWAAMAAAARVAEAYQWMVDLAPSGARAADRAFCDPDPAFEAALDDAFAACVRASEELLAVDDPFAVYCARALGGVEIDEVVPRAPAVTLPPRFPRPRF
jgi:hypothetical protein